MSVLERFVILMYSRTCAEVSVNVARQAMFAQGTKQIDNIPPTLDALKQHSLRAADLKQATHGDRVSSPPKYYHAQSVGVGKPLEMDGYHAGPSSARRQVLANF